MRMLLRIIALACFAVALGQALVLRHATGGGLFTQLPSRTLARMQDSKPAEEPFAGLGMDDLAGTPTKVDNAFRLGLLPAGPGNGLADSASVLTFSGPTLVLLVITWVATRRPRTKQKSGD